MTKHPLKGRGQGHVTHFQFRARNHISGTVEAIVAKFCLWVEYVKRKVEIRFYTLMGVVRVT